MSLGDLFLEDAQSNHEPSITFLQDLYGNPFVCKIDHQLPKEWKFSQISVIQASSRGTSKNWKVDSMGVPFFIGGDGHQMVGIAIE